jgi:molecular chaperone GrpE
MEETSVEENKQNNEQAPEQNTSAEQILAELNDKYLRLYSDFENYKKRTLKERIDLIKTAGEDVYKNMLPVLDDFERANKANENTTDLKAINEGLKLVYQKLAGILKSNGVEDMQAVGTEFNPDLHEAITNIPAPTDDLKGKVIEVIEKGYLLNGKVIRFAKVIVGA